MASCRIDVSRWLLPVCVRSVATAIRESRVNPLPIPSIRRLVAPEELLCDQTLSYEAKEARVAEMTQLEVANSLRSRRDGMNYWRVVIAHAGRETVAKWCHQC